METGYAQTNGIRLHYVTEGEGSLVILLHGFPEFWYSWRRQIPVLSKSFKVVALDMRGYNLSDKPEGRAAYTAPELAADIKGIVHHFGYEKAIVVGHDWGGGVAYAFARRYPENLEKLVILNSPHPSLMMKNLKENPRQLLRSWYMIWFQLPLLPEFFMSRMLKKIIRDSFLGWAVHKENFPEDDLEKYVEVFRKPGTLTAALNYYRAFFVKIHENQEKHSRRITCPSMVIWGENDKALGKELTYGLNKYHTGPFELHYIPNCSHWVQNDCPEAVNDLLLNFLVKKKEIKTPSTEEVRD